MLTIIFIFIFCLTEITDGHKNEESSVMWEISLLFCITDDLLSILWLYVPKVPYSVRNCSEFSVCIILISTTYPPYWWAFKPIVLPSSKTLFLTFYPLSLPQTTFYFLLPFKFSSKTSLDTVVLSIKFLYLYYRSTVHQMWSPHIKMDSIIPNIQKNSTDGSDHAIRLL